jgi:hypothetical protein
MSAARPIRERVAAAIYAEVGVKTEQDFYNLPPYRAEGWLRDADRAIPIVVRAACRVADARDPEKPSRYLIRRERISSAFEKMLLGSGDWECPIADPECIKNCGSYGCGN